jgi:hypothetical protein
MAPDVRRELESHLRDSIAELRQRGLNDDESFWLARRRADPRQRLGEEFHKVEDVTSLVLIGLLTWFLPSPAGSIPTKAEAD